MVQNRSPVDIRRRRIDAAHLHERVKFVREWMRGYDAKDGIDLRKPLTKAQRRRVHATYNKLRKITPGTDSQQRWIVKEVRSERSSKLYQEYAKLPVKLKGLKRVPITSTPWRHVTGPALPKFHIDYRARGGKGEVRQMVGKARVKVIDFDKVRLLTGDAEYLDELVSEFPKGGIGTLIMGGREQVMMPWASDANTFRENIIEIMERYAPVDEDIDEILSGLRRPEDADNYYDENDRYGSPWPQWLQGARIYYRTDGKVDYSAEAYKAPKQKKRKAMTKRQRIKGR